MVSSNASSHVSDDITVLYSEIVVRMIMLEYVMIADR